MKFLSLLLILAFVAPPLVGCGSDSQRAPTAQEATDFKGKPITPEQKAKGMAAAMGGAGTKAATPKGGS